MIESPPDDGAVVDAHSRQAKLGNGKSQIDRGNAAAPDDLCRAAVVNPGENAVTLPRFQPGRRCVIQASRLEVNRPRSVLSLIANNATQESAAVRPRSFDQQRYLAIMRHRNLGLAETKPDPGNSNLLGIVAEMDLDVT